MTKRHHQPDGRSTSYRGADGLWHGRVSMGLTDQGRKDRRHVSSRIFSYEIGRAMNPRTDWDHWKNCSRLREYGMADSTTRATPLRRCSCSWGCTSARS
jgi:hypothetical protein